MKKSYKIFSMIVVFCMVVLFGSMVSSNQVKAASSINMYYSSRTFDYKQNRGYVSFYGQSCQYIAYSMNSSWLHIKAGGGTVTGNAPGLLDYTVDENTSNQSRTGTIIIFPMVNDAEQLTYKVTQTAFEETITLTSTSKNISYGSINSRGGYDDVSSDISFTSNCSWTASASSWITLAETSGSKATTNKTLKFTAKPNTADTAREGYIKITSQYGITRTCKIIQSKTKYIEIITDAGRVYPDKECTGVLEFYAACNWSLSLTENFVTCSKSSGDPGLQSIQISLSRNSTYDSRSCYATLRSLDHSFEATMFISQQANSVPAIQGIPTYSTYNASKFGAKNYIVFTANTDWTIETDYFIDMWPSSGSAGTQMVNYTIDANYTGEERSGFIYISAGNQYYTIYVLQDK